MAIGAALWAWAAVAPADPGLQLGWEAPPGCPSEQEVRARVVRLVGEEAARAARLRARGRVRADGQGWRLELELSGETGGGQRSLTAARCEELAEAGALVVAIAVDPRAALAGEGVVPAPPGEVNEGAGPSGQANEEAGPPGQVAEGAGPPGQVEGAAADAPAGELPPDDEPAPRVAGPARQDRVHVGLRVAGGVMFARILPRTGAAVNVTLSVGGRRWRAEIGGLYAPPVAGGDARLGGRFQLGAVEIRGCPVLRRGRFEAPLCLGLQVGAIRGRGTGSALMEKMTAHALWAAATLGAAVAWRPRERIALWLQADAVVALTRPQFVTALGVPVHASARVGGQALAGLEVRLR